jgi:formyl-CoA transferase
MRYITGYPDRAPVRVGISIGDSLAAMFGVIGALMAIHHRQSTGRGQVVDVALYEAVFAMMESMLPEYGMDGFVRERSGAALPGDRAVEHLPVPRRQVRRHRAQRRFDLQANDAGHRDDPTSPTDPSVADNAGRVRRTEELDRIIGEWTAGNDLETVLAIWRKRSALREGSIRSPTSPRTCTTGRAG